MDGTASCLGSEPFAHHRDGHPNSAALLTYFSDRFASAGAARSGALSGHRLVLEAWSQPFPPIRFPRMFLISASATVCTVLFGARDVRHLVELEHELSKDMVLGLGSEPQDVTSTMLSCLAMAPAHATHSSAEACPRHAL